jgi:chromosome segregation ATPase
MSDCCEKLGQALNNLNSKVDGINGKLGNLDNRLNGLEAKQKRCCQDKKEQKPPDSLEDILRRLAKLERYCESVEDFIKKLSPILNVIVGIFK